VDAVAPGKRLAIELTRGERATGASWCARGVRGLPKRDPRIQRALRFPSGFPQHHRSHLSTTEDRVMQNSERVALVLLAVALFALIAIPLSGAGMYAHAFGYDTSDVGLLRLFGMALGGFHDVNCWSRSPGLAQLARSPGLPCRPCPSSFARPTCHCPVWQPRHRLRQARTDSPSCIQRCLRGCRASVAASAISRRTAACATVSFGPTVASKHTRRGVARVRTRL
jgi:hypothetical protein